LAGRAGASFGNQKDEGSECKIIDKAANEGPGHFGVVRFQVAQIFYKNGANDYVSCIEDDQKAFQAFGVTFVEE